MPVNIVFSPALPRAMGVPGSNESLNVTYTLSPQNSSAFTVLYLAQYFATVQVLSTCWPAIILFGFISNIVNIIVFVKSGAKDNVGVLVISLAVSDLTFLVLITPSLCGHVIFAFFRSHSWPFDHQFISYLFYWPAFTAYDLSTYISVSLGVMRCACVAMPLKFKLVFTKSKTIIWVIFLVVLTISLQIPMLSILRISWKTDPSTNKSVPYLLSRNFESMSQINDVLNRGIMIYLAYATMIICVSVLSLKLYQAAQIRRSCTAGGMQQPGQTSDKTVTKTMSTKDLQVVKSVALVCSIFIVAQFPFLLSSTIRLIIPEFNSGKRLSGLFGVFSQVSRTCSYLNASINIFVYYNYNSKYRDTFKSLFCAKVEK